MKRSRTPVLRYFLICLCEKLLHRTPWGVVITDLQFSGLTGIGARFELDIAGPQLHKRAVAHLCNCTFAPDDVPLENSEQLILPERWAKALRFVARYRAEFNRSPSMRELSAGSGRKETSNPRYMVMRLRAMGLLEQTDKQHRTLDLTEAGRRWVRRDAKQFEKKVLTLEAPQ